MKDGSAQALPFFNQLRSWDVHEKGPLAYRGLSAMLTGGYCRLGGMSPKGDRIPPALRATSL